MPFINVLQNAENARAGGEFKGLILACTVRYETMLRVFIFAIFIFFFFCNFQNRSRKMYFKKVPSITVPTTV